MTEALDIMRRLLDGEKLTYEGDFYVTDRAKLYSPPIGRVPILLAAGGPKSATLAGERADGVVTSVKDPADTRERVIEPLTEAAKEAGRSDPMVLATTLVVVCLQRRRSVGGPVLVAWSPGPRPTGGGRPGDAPPTRRRDAT